MSQYLVRSNSSAVYLTLGTLMCVDLLGMGVVAGGGDPGDTGEAVGLGGALGDTA